MADLTSTAVSSSDVTGERDAPYDVAVMGSECSGQGCSSSKTNGPLISDCQPLWHQVAGHFYGSKKVNGGMLKHSSGMVLKGVQKPPKGLRERNFYRDVFSELQTNIFLLQLRLFLPLFYGIYRFPGEPIEEYIMMEDLAARFNKPCILDVKIGAQTYDPLATPAKIQYELLKWPPILQVGFLLIGMRVFQPSTQSYFTLDKNFGRSLTEESVSDGLARFFTQDLTFREDMVTSVLKVVGNISDWFHNQKSFHFYASSLLIIYEGLPPGPRPKPLPQSTLNGVYDMPICDFTERTIDNKGANENDNCLLCNPDITNIQSNTANSSQLSHIQHTAYTNIDNDLVVPTSGNLSQTIPSESRCGKHSQSSQEAVVKMIDFTHVFPSTVRDENYLFGLEKFQKYLNGILRESGECGVPTDVDVI